MNRNGSSLYFWLSVSILSWGSSFVAMKIALNGLNPFELASYRFTVASLTLIPIALFSNFKWPTWHDFKFILALAILGVYVYHLTLNYAMLHFSPNSVSFIANASPIFTTLIAIVFLKEKVKPLGWIGFILSLAGVYGITYSETESGSPLDSIVLVLVPILWGLFFVLQKPLLKRLRPIEIMSYSLWIGTVLFLFTSTGFLGRLQQIPQKTHAAAIYLGVFPTAIAYLSWSIVLSKIPVSRASSFSYLVPLVTMVVSLFIIHEKPTVALIVGGSLVLLGVYLVNSSAKKGK